MSPPPEDVRNRWDTTAYDGTHSFVFEYGEDVVALLDPQPGERIVDLGCGTGHLANRIAAAGADVVGLDNSAEMIEEARARNTHSNCRFVCEDARSATFDASFDAVFSNAALHWIQEQEQDAVLNSVADALRPGGRFVAELGGIGNVSGIVDATQSELTGRGYESDSPWYFPSIGEYATKLEKHGFEVRNATLFDRPTKLDEGTDGLTAWLDMFGDSLLSPLSEDERRAVVSNVEDRLRHDQFIDGTWIADYRRLRVVAVLTEE